MAKATVCLNMIVKNEARVIRRCFESVRPFIDAWVIVDTGSTDGTQELIREELADVPGELFERPWKNFGHNRSEALELARGRADYTMIIDADEILIPAPGFTMPELTADEYMTLHEAGKSSTAFFLTQLVKSELPWRFDGVLHEVIACDVPHSTEKLKGLVCKGFFDSARNADPKAKYESDARVLEQALKDEPDNARYVFYLAQSYRDAGQLEQAVETYRRRVTLGGWDEEVWYAQYQVGVLLERLGGDFGPALEACLAAYQLRPTRAEPLCELARHYRQEKQYPLAHLFARRAQEIQRPNDILFLDESVYAWRAIDELGVAAYYVGRHEEALAAADLLLGGGRLPETELARVTENRKFAVDALGTSLLPKKHSKGKKPHKQKNKKRR